MLLDGPEKELLYNFLGSLNYYEMMVILSKIYDKEEDMEIARGNINLITCKLGSK